MAHKKAAGSAKNLRDSNPKYRGLKLAGGQFAHAGNIIIRQKGDKYKLGHNVYMGKDFTVHAMIDGVVSFRKKNFIRFDGRKYLKTVVDIIPAESTGETLSDKVAQSKKTSPSSTGAQKQTSAIKKNDTKAAEKTDAKTHDLTELEGVGPKTKEALQAAGIMTCEDLAHADIEKIQDALQAAGGRTASMDPTPRIEQAKSLA